MGQNADNIHSLDVYAVRAWAVQNGEAFVDEWPYNMLKSNLYKATVAGNQMDMNIHTKRLDKFTSKLVFVMCSCHLHAIAMVDDN